MTLEPVIGLEIHIQLKTQTKLFCRCPNKDEGDRPNVRVCPICMGHPGTLPVLNREAVRSILRFGTAIGSAHPNAAHFDRKNYFYPDLPKGYQISQLEFPFCLGGEVTYRLDGTPRTARITRVHLEEDAAKNLHTSDGSLVDYNRAGTPLCEMVTEADFRSPAEAKAFVQEIRTLVTSLGISDGDLEKGHLRCDANISLRPVGDPSFYPKTEVKNINSYRAIERALTAEIERQTKLWETGMVPTISETRGWDPEKGETFSQRNKEEANDYRYFPEPDIPPISQLTEVFMTPNIGIGELPEAKRLRFESEYSLAPAIAQLLVSDHRLAGFYEETMSELLEWLQSFKDPRPDWTPARCAQITANWMTGEMLAWLNEQKKTIEDTKITAENFGEFLAMLIRGDMNRSAAQTIFPRLFEGVDPSAELTTQGLEQVNDLGAIEGFVDAVIAEQAGAVADYDAGKAAALQFLIGQVMKASRGKADSSVVRDVLEKKLTRTP